jgi:hypothetical protein
MLSLANFMSNYSQTADKNLASLAIIGGYFFMAVSFVNLMYSIGFKKF